MGYFTGYFMVMIVLMIIAVIRASNGKPWIWYSIGVGLQLLGLLGAAKRYNALGMGHALTGRWIAFLAISVISFIIIHIRKNNK